MNLSYLTFNCSYLHEELEEEVHHQPKVRKVGNSTDPNVAVKESKIEIAAKTEAATGIQEDKNSSKSFNC